MGVESENERCITIDKKLSKFDNSIEILKKKLLIVSLAEFFVVLFD